MSAVPSGGALKAALLATAVTIVVLRVLKGMVKSDPKSIAATILGDAA